MDNILDKIEIKNDKKTYSRFSAINSLITFGLFFYIGSSAPQTIKATDFTPVLPIIPITAFLVFCLTGIMVTILSFAKKEPHTLMKWLGGFFNILLFIGTVGLAIFINSI